MFAPGVPEVLTEFKSDDQLLGSFVVSVYILGYAVGPLFIAPLSELYGRLVVYHTGNVLFITFTIACAVSSNLNMLIAFRFLEGCAGVVPLTIGGGTIADMIIQEKRGGAMALWAMGPLMGPVVGPVAGGFLSQAKGWRWVFWVITMAVSHCYISDTARELTQLGWSRHPSRLLLSPRNVPACALGTESWSSTKRDRQSEPKIEARLGPFAQSTPQTFRHSSHETTNLLAYRSGHVHLHGRRLWLSLSYLHHRYRSL